MKSSFRLPLLGREPPSPHGVLRGLPVALPFPSRSSPSFCSQDFVSLGPSSSSESWASLSPAHRCVQETQSVPPLLTGLSGNGLDRGEETEGAERGAGEGGGARVCLWRVTEAAGGLPLFPSGSRSPVISRCQQAEGTCVTSPAVSRHEHTFLHALLECSLLKPAPCGEDPQAAQGGPVKEDASGRCDSLSGAGHRQRAPPSANRRVQAGQFCD